MMEKIVLFVKIYHMHRFLRYMIKNISVTHYYFVRSYVWISEYKRVTIVLFSYCLVFHHKMRLRKHSPSNNSLEF